MDKAGGALGGDGWKFIATLTVIRTNHKFSSRQGKITVNHRKLYPVCIADHQPSVSGVKASIR